MQKTKKKTNKKKHRRHYPRVYIECLYVKTENSGRELIQLELTYKTGTIGLKKYFGISTDWMLQ